MMIKEDPPAAWNRGSDRNYAEMAEKLKADPGAWYRVSDTDRNQLASNIKGGRIVAFRPAGSFEATSRKNTDKITFTIWARYVGES